MHDDQCPKCGSRDVTPRTVNDRIRAADSRGQTFEVALHWQVLRCRACRFCWQGAEAEVAKEAAYQNALVERSAERTVTHIEPR